MSARRRPRPRHRRELPEPGPASRSSKRFLPPATASTACRGWPEPAKPRPSKSIREGAERAGYAVEGFAPTSKAAGQLREAGIMPTTLQGFLSRGGGAGRREPRQPASLHAGRVESGQHPADAAFLEKIGPQDRVLVIGDIRQHQGVDAGRPFEQMQDAGMRTSQLDQIMRQKDPELSSASSISPETRPKQA